MIVRSAVAPALCSEWLASIDDSFGRADTAPVGMFVVESSSFRLTGLGAPSVEDVWSALSPDAHRRCAELLDAPLAIDADQCWVRRQYGPGEAPARHRPHSWHQDGALGFDFLAHGDGPIPPDALLRMVTCWIALTACGDDAPGLELVTDGPTTLLTPTELRDEAVEARWPAAARIRPVLHAGDALVFGGDVLHRTHVTSSMARTRTSIELRCFAADAIPQRLRGDRFVAVLTPRRG